MKKILIVDDSNPSRLSLSFSLSQRGYEVITADNGNVGFAKTIEHPDLALIITDINMPQMNGFEMIHRIRREPEFQKIPIIALSSDDENGNEAINLGATAFIIKSSKTSEEIKRFLELYLK